MTGLAEWMAHWINALRVFWLDDEFNDLMDDIDEMRNASPLYTCMFCFVLKLATLVPLLSLFHNLNTESSKCLVLPLAFTLGSSRSGRSKQLYAA